MMKSQEKRTFKVFSKMKKKFFSKLSSMSSPSILCLSFTCHWSHCLNKGSTFVFSAQTRASGGLPWWTSTCQCRGHGFLPWSRQISHSLGQLGPCATTQSPRAATIEARTPQTPSSAREDTAKRSLGTETREQPPISATRESPSTLTKTQHSQKLIN